MRTLVGAADHEPTELVVTAPAGMALVELEALLAEKGQCLAFEPPRFGPASTVGGMVAAGLSGPSRAAAGSLRDHLLGVTLISGTRRADALRRPRHQERRRLRRLAPDRRIARHPRRHRRGLAQGAGARPGRGDAALRLQAGRSARAAARLGRAAAAARRQRLVERQPDRSPARREARRWRRQRARSAAKRSRPPRQRRSGRACATTPTRSSSPPTTRSPTRTRPCGACRCRRPRRCSASPATS